jgi:hypothetical protein
MAGRQLGAVLMALVPCAVRVMTDGIAVGKAMHNMAAMTEGHDRRRCREAKNSEKGDHHRPREPSPVRSALMRLSLVAGASSRKLATDQKTRYEPRIIATFGQPALA